MREAPLLLKCLLLLRLFKFGCVNQNDPKNFTRSWFAWANTLFGEMIYRLVQEGKTDLLNNLG